MHAEGRRAVVEMMADKTVKSDYWTLSATTVDSLRLPLVPVTVSEYVPRAACLFAVTVRVELEALPETETGLGLKLPLVNLGRPLTLRFTLPVNPPDGVTVIVSVALEPRATEIVPLDAPSVKLPPLGAEVTVSETLVELVRLLSVPVTVKV
jgi:hypothetical protein